MSHSDPLNTDDVYYGLRANLFEIDPAEVGLGKNDFPYPVYAIVMESGSENGSYTLVVMGDGTTSLYIKGGGGIIGAGSHEKVRTAAKKLLSGAQHFHIKAKFVKKHPIPEDGETIFYFLSHEGTRSYSNKTDNFGYNKDELSGLFHAAHSVISEVRQLEE